MQKATLLYQILTLPAIVRSDKCLGHDNRMRDIAFAVNTQVGEDVVTNLFLDLKVCDYILIKLCFKLEPGIQVVERLTNKILFSYRTVKYRKRNYQLMQENNPNFPGGKINYS